MTDQELIQQIANGGSFDQVNAIRALARVMQGSATTDKQAPSAVMDAPDEEETGTKRRKPKPEATA
jgi:hypothetical protein